MRVPACSDSRHNKVKAKGFSFVLEIFSFLHQAIFEIFEPCKCCYGCVDLDERCRIIIYLFLDIVFQSLFSRHIFQYFFFQNIFFTRSSKTFQNVVDVGKRCRIKVDPPTYSLINARTTENILESFFSRFFQGAR